MNRGLLVILAALVIVTIIIIFNGPTTSFCNTRVLHQEISFPRKLHVSDPVVQNEKTLPDNIPPIYADPNAKPPVSYNKTCAKFPQLLDIQFTNDLWQTQKTTHGSLQLFNAYLDHRIETRNFAVRVITMYDQFLSNETFFCQVWYEGQKEPSLVKSEKLQWVWYKSWGGTAPGMYHPYILTCVINRDPIPISVSIVETPCENSTNNLRLSYEEKIEEDKKDFVVCVKGLNFPYQDQSVRLVEWIELLFILGADKINFYQFHVHPTTQRVLDYYSNAGMVEVTPLTLLGGVSNTPYLQSSALQKKTVLRRLQEVIPYNDCLYKHLQDYRFVVLLDTDEVIVPTTGTWIDLLDKIKVENRTSYLARNVYFLDSHQHDHDWFEDIPRFLHMLQHVYRAENYTKPGYFVKGFHDTRGVMALHNHFPVRCLGRECLNLNIDLELAHLQHYRSDCVKGVKDCDLMKNHSIVDTRVWNYKKDLIERSVDTLNELDLLRGD